MKRVLVLFVILLSSNKLLSQTEISFDIDNFWVYPGINSYINGISGVIAPHLGLGFKFISDYKYKLLKLKKEKEPLVSHYLSGSFVWHLGFINYFQVGMVLPVVFYQKGDLYPLGEDFVLSSTATKDIRFYLEWKIFGSSPIGPPPKGFFLAFVGGISIPSGDSKNFAGDKSIVGETLMIGEYIHPKFSIALNIGARLRKRSTLFDFKAGHQLIWSLSGKLFLWKERLCIIGEYWGSLWLDDIRKDRLNTEIRGGLGYYFGKNKDFVVSIGGGGGLGKAPLTPLLELFLMISYEPNRYDTDRDKIPDEKDECINKPEDRDGFSDEDGCPDLDNDEDGILDEIDKCRDEPEDKDGVEDQDGCPE